MSKNLGGYNDQSTIPVLALANRSADRVLQVVGEAVADIGGMVGEYVGLGAMTWDVNDAVNLKGDKGDAGATGATGATGAAGADGLPGATALPNATIAESSLTTLALGVRRVTVAVAGAVTGGNYLAFPTAALPAGFGIVDAICTTNGQITFGMLVPILTVGSYSITVRVVKIL